MSRFLVGSKNLAIKAGGGVKKYIVTLYNDYSAVMKEGMDEWRQKPWKGVLTVGAVGGIIYAIKTNPDEKNFMENLIEDRLKLSQVGDSSRNPSSTEYVEQMAQKMNRGLIRRTNLILFSIIWQSDYDEKCDLYAAHCKNLKPKWREFHRRILDVGVFGRWYNLNRAMIDYDVNPNEFLV